MRLFFVFAVLLITGFETATFGQKTSYDSRYKAAVEDYKQRKFALCMEKLLPLTSTTSIYPNAEYAHYYYALAAYESKKFKESKQMLLQLQNRFPSWNKQNEVNYLLGANSLATGQWKDGFNSFQKIRDASFTKDIQAIKHNYLARIGDLPTLISLQKQFPNDREVAIELVQFVSRSPKSTATDRYYADQLVKQFKLAKDSDSKAESREKYSTSKTDNQWTKGYFNVSVLLPFRLEEYLTSKKRTNQFAYDYYMGLLIAKEKLKSEGVDIRLLPFDVNNEPGVMKSIVKDEVFQKSDLVIGPLYQGTFDIAADYVTDVNMVMLNPLSTDGALLKASENIFLAHPSISFQMQKAAQWMRSVATGNQVAIYYGGSTKDSLMAAAYWSEITSKGGKVIEMFKVRPEREFLEGKIASFATQKPSHVAIFSSENGTGSALLETLNNRKLTTIPVIATSTAFNLQHSKQNRYGGRLYLIEPDHVDRDKDDVRLFQKNYWNLANTFPSVYSYQGYDQMLFFGRMLNKYKDKLSQGLEMRQYSEDYLLTGFDYTKSRDNQVPFILRYVGGKWESIK